MRAAPFLAAVALLSCAVLPVRAAEIQLFVVANHADGYGVDRCLAAGEPCGRPIAAAYCKSRAFTSVVSYRKVDRDASAGASETCKSRQCEAFVAIECQR